MADNQDDIQINSDDENLDDSVLAEEHMSDAVKKLRERLKQAEGKAKEYLDGWQRSQAEFVNLRKRDEEGRQEFLKFANAGLIQELLPVLDALDSAVAHGDTGIQNTYNLLLKTFAAHGLEVLDPVGEAFDPARHEAVSMTTVDSPEKDHQILEVMQKGYIMSDKVIRPAKVTIGNYNG